MLRKVSNEIASVWFRLNINAPLPIVRHKLSNLQTSNEDINSFSAAQH